MKKTLFVCIIIISVVLFSSCIEINTAVFEFSITPEYITAATDSDSFISLTVTTTCIKGRYSYKGSSTILGGVPTIYNTDGGKLVNANAINITADVALQTIKKGDVITQTWEFHKVFWGTEYYWEPGTYDILIEYAGSSTIFEGAVVILPLH